jgi:hypothetical protein
MSTEAGQPHLQDCAYWFWSFMEDYYNHPHASSCSSFTYLWPSTCSNTQEAQKRLRASGPKGLKPIYYSILIHKRLHLFVTEHILYVTKCTFTVLFTVFWTDYCLHVLFMPGNRIYMLSENQWTKRQGQ